MNDFVCWKQYLGVREIYIYRQLENIEKVWVRLCEIIGSQNVTFSSMMPKYALEFLAVMAMLIYFSFSISDGSIAQVIPTVVFWHLLAIA